MVKKRNSGTGAQGPISPSDYSRGPSSARAQEYRREMAGTGYDEGQLENEAYEETMKELSNRNSRAGAGAGGLGSYRKYLEKMMKSSMRDYNNLISRLGQQANISRGTINSSMGNLSSLLQGQVNPYANFQTQQAPVNPQLQQLLASQDVSGSPVQDLASALNAQNQGQATAFSNLVNALGANWQQGQQGQLADVAAQQGQLQRGLDANQLALLLRLQQGNDSRQQQFMRLMLQAMGR